MRRQRSATWSAIVDWSHVLPPSRPSRWQLQLVRAVLAKLRKNSPVAVLGSTPEYRDLLAELGFSNIFIFERNPQFLRRITHLRCYHNPENIIQGDWIETLPKFANTFSVVLSDLTSGNIPYECRENFYRAVANALSKTGVFVDKILTHPIAHDRLPELEAQFQTYPANLDTFNRFSCKFFFCSELLDIRSEVDSTLFYKLLERRFADERLRAMLAGARLITPEGCRWWYGIEWRRLRREYFGFFSVIKCVHDVADSPYAGRCRVYVLARR